MVVVLLRNSESRTCLVNLLCRFQLDAAGFDCGPDALLAMRRQKPSFVVLDAYLGVPDPFGPPTPDGLDVLREIRADQTLADLRVFVTSVDQAPRAEAMALGAECFAVKPFDLGLILDIIRGRPTAYEPAGDVHPAILRFLPRTGPVTRR